MSEGRKRRRSLQDSPVELSNMRMTLNRLNSLKAELNGIQETDEEMDTILKHVLPLEGILRGAKKQVCSILIVFYTTINDAAENDFLDR